MAVDDECYELDQRRLNPLVPQIAACWHVKTSVFVSLGDAAVKSVRTEMRKNKNEKEKRRGSRGTDVEGPQGNNFLPAHPSSPLRSDLIVVKKGGFLWKVKCIVKTNQLM